MLYTKEQLLQYLQENHINYQLYTHDPLFTCEQALEIVAKLNMPGMGVKNLFLKDDQKKLHLISAAYSTTINLKEVGKNLGLKGLRFADETLLMNHLYVKPGSVTPLALINDQKQQVQMILDAELFKQKFLQVHPLKNEATVVIAPSDLVIFFNLINRPYVQYDFINNQIDSSN